MRVEARLLRAPPIFLLPVAADGNQPRAVRLGHAAQAARDFVAVSSGSPMSSSTTAGLKLRPRCSASWSL